MVRDQCPCIALRLRLFQDKGKADKKGFPVLVIPEYVSSLDPACHYVLQEAGSIESSLTGHWYLTGIIV